MGTFGLLFDVSARPDEELRARLTQCGYLIRVVRDGERAVEQMRDESLCFTLIRTDNGDAVELCHGLRPLSSAPLLVVCTESDERTTVLYLEAGADSVLLAPLSRRELAARLSAALGASRPHRTARQPRSCRAGDLFIDVDAHLATKRGRMLSLTPTEFRLLVALAMRAGEIVSHAELIEEVWNRDNAQGAENLRLYIRYLRQKLGDDPVKPRLLLTHRGIGYRLVATREAVASTNGSVHGGSEAGPGAGLDARTRRRLRQGQPLATRSR